MKRTALLMAMLMGCAAASASAAGLDGTQWKMRFSSARSWLHIWKGDMLSFDGGQFRSDECGSYGFHQAAYAAKRRDGSQVWTSTLYNADGERTDWQGVLVGDKMSGSFTWSKPDGQTRTYKFSAKLSSRERLTVRTP